MTEYAAKWPGIRRFRRADSQSGGGGGPLLDKNMAIDHRLDDLKAALNAHSIVAYTDDQGIITEVNEKFIEISQYSRDELIGAPQSIEKSGQHSTDFFRNMWKTISSGEIWQGEICNRAKGGNEYWVATTIVPLLDTAGKIAQYISLRTETTNLHQADLRLQKNFYFDRQTGLPSYAYIVKHLTESVLSAGSDSRVFVLAGFEDLPIVSDSFGYGMSDQLLSPVVDQLNAIVESGQDEMQGYPLSLKPDVISRIGASTFGAAFRGITGTPEQVETAAGNLADQFRFLLEDIVRIDLGVSISPTLRVGYVIYRPGDDIDGVDLFSNAEFALKHAALNSDTPNTPPTPFGEEVVNEAYDRMSLLHDLRVGISRGQLRLHLQPIVDADRTTRCYEALVRWEHPTRGYMQPDDFIPLAESTGLIMNIGQWVFNEVCSILTSWATGPEKMGLSIMVNVSSRQLQSGLLVETVRDATDAHGVSPRKLGIEITETMMHANIDSAIETLDELQQMGVQVALDDFGTGYSSLSHLSRLPVNQLKIDRSFIAAMNNDQRSTTMLGAIVYLGRAMNLEIIAEGVETEEQFAGLKNLDIDGFQGFLFDKGQPVSALSDPTL